MARFRYAYQKIVDLKTSEKSQAEWQLSVVVGELQTEEQSLLKLHQDRAEWSDRLQLSSNQAVTLSELMVIQEYIEYLDICIKQKMMDIQKAEAAVEVKRIALSERMKDEKVWQKSKDNARQRFQADMLLIEQNELDEMASVRFMYAAH
ncbi:flagellar export protein FliJ [Paenibacillus lignilyticus]|uniref:Flagellar FliJ protein n=1 Tax=Paenibacillus lignilyticus TaxID=1172615 RepID=A0ABS5CHH2_9BACL|nr:flagellar export protein FliJ [Paenibacillus lignilyticus]MBP3965257.1 flagellar export protein FliJ [Paenibacillus lignilyticus]